MLAMSGLMLGTARADEPKRYSVNLAEARIGSTDLEAGEYKVIVHRDESKAELMDAESHKVFDLTGKVQEVESKFSRTEVISQIVDGVKRVNEIRIGGTKFRVDFRQGS
jgi:hypothetical protein